MILVLAGNYRQAEDWARNLRLGPRSWSYLSNRESLRGIHGEPIVRVGTWHENALCSDVEAMERRGAVVPVTITAGFYS